MLSKPTYVCDKCYLTFTKNTILERHKKVCGIKFVQDVQAAPEGSVTCFKNFANGYQSDFVFYADFETMSIQENVQKGEKTVLSRRLVPVSCAVLRVSVNTKYNTVPYVFHGENVMEQFFNYLAEEQKILEIILKKNVYDIDMTQTDEDAEVHKAHVPVREVEPSPKETSVNM